MKANLIINMYAAGLFAFAAFPLIPSAHGAVLLSSNNTTGPYPGNVTTLGAGATYTWQNLGTGNGPGNTDAQTLSNDPSFTKMTDGYVAPSGLNAIYSGYGAAGNAGQTSIFDLGTTRSVDYVTLSAQVATNQQGIGYFTAYTSNDGTNFTLFGRWSEAAPVDSSNAVLTIDPTGSVDARYVMFYTNRYAGNVGETALPGQATFYQQAILGEQAVWGAAIPEPATSGLLVLGGAWVLALRRRRTPVKF